MEGKLVLVLGALLAVLCTVSEAMSLPGSELKHSQLQVSGFHSMIVLSNVVIMAPYNYMILLLLFSLYLVSLYSKSNSCGCESGLMIIVK